jgi:protein O-GlcNAc transferase
MDAVFPKPCKPYFGCEQADSFAVDAELRKAVEFQQNGRLAAAEGRYLNILKYYPEQPDALHLLGVIAHQKGSHDEAERLICRAIRIVPGNPYYLNNLGAVYKAKGKLPEAISCYKNAIQLKPDYLDAHVNLARAFHVLKEFRQAVYYYKKAIELSPDHFESHYHLGILFHEQRCLKGAISCFQKALELKPDFAQTYYRMGAAFHDQGRLEKALSHYRKAIDLKTDFFEAYNGMGSAWQSLKEFGKALSCFYKALDLMPCSDVVYVNMGNVLREQGRYRKALTCYRKALEIQPENAVAHLNMGIFLMDMGKSEEAVSSYRRALELKPDYAKACAYLVSRLQQDCAWQELKHWSMKLDDLTKSALDRKERPAETPFLNIVRHADPALNFTVAKMWSGKENKLSSNCRPSIFFGGRLSCNHRITVGYLSSNFRDHPTAHLMHDLFEMHNRESFNVFCYSYGQNDGSSYRARIQHNCDRFVELGKLNDTEAAQKIFEDKVDILVGLAGHTEGHRMEICAFRPAPVQVRYLGMPGTTGADYFDYIITDPIVTPNEHAPFYSEKFVYLPHCYQINSTRRAISDCIFNREKLGLPENGFVFCSFNTNYKLDPVMFDVWMRILGRVRGSVLWLIKGNEAVVRNLRQEAESRDIDPDRIVFARKLAKDEHLARLQFANLALDTRIVNGAITTSDALWSGVPVLSVKGGHFASRMSSSILSAVGLREMVTTSLKEYESLAVRLANNPPELVRIRKKLEKNRKTKPLFDTPRFVKHLEKAYEEMLEIFQAGGEPRQIEMKDEE